MKVLFIGGTGIISSACSALAVSRGIELYHLNRGQSAAIRNVNGVKTLTADVRNLQAAKKALDEHTFDAVVDWIAFEPEHISMDIQLFTGRTKQFVFISSASAYQTPPASLPVTEQTPLDNPFWEYSRKKIACEEVLREAFKNNGFPYTIIRPSHTYDKTLLPLVGGYTAFHRIKNGLPVVVHGDGTSLWTLTHHADFAVGLVGVLGKQAAINEAYHITSDEWLSWNTIYELIAGELGVTPTLVHVPSEIIARYNSDIGDGLLGDKAHSMLFDNSKIKALVPDFNATIPFSQGVKEIVNWYTNNASLYDVNPTINSLFDTLVNDFSKLGR